ncbi:hypothetical protein CEXT_402971 [Caerostris extrusa]|uniref:Uncharacterized protein n=1 Tax=Caerostris extrusa TaxID=172846 RepID=A0AAV4N3V2_CAEEX|nr:hypothetical protein CEXT_402971 [Caerostris extrusa]
MWNIEPLEFARVDPGKGDINIYFKTITNEHVMGYAHYPEEENKFSNLNVDESSAGVDFATAEPKLPPIMGAPKQTPAVLSTTENQHNNNNNTINNDDNVNDTSKMLYVLTEMKNVFNMFGGLSNIYAKLRNANNPLDKLQVLLACFETSNSMN